MWKRRFPYKQYDKWSHEPAEKRRWTLALEKWGPKRVEVGLSDRAPGCVRGGEGDDYGKGIPSRGSSAALPKGTHQQHHAKSRTWAISTMIRRTLNGVREQPDL
jgi:hypothetical protein